MLLVSVHLPKTAGTSFGASLKAHFGDRYRDDYGDGGIGKPFGERCMHAMASAMRLAEEGGDAAACIHGHFLPLKYLLLGVRRELVFMTWMRDPVERLVSHYHFWQQSYDPGSSAPHHREVIERGWSLERFCFSERFRNIYTQYLWGFPFENFSFIGISEFYEQDMVDFSGRYLGYELKSQRLNVTSCTRSRVDPGFATEVRDFHAADMLLYRRALELRSIRRLGQANADHQVRPRRTSLTKANPG